MCTGVLPVYMFVYKPCLVPKSKKDVISPETGVTGAFEPYVHAWNQT